MYLVEFELDGKNTLLQCRENELFENICKRFCVKVQIDFDNYYFLYNGKNLNKKLKLSQTINYEDRRRKKMIILVNEIPDFITKNLNIDNERKSFYTIDNEINDIDNEINDNSKQYHKLLSENRTLSSSNLRLKTNLDSLDKENDELRERNDELEKENEELKQKIKNSELDTKKRKSFSIDPEYEKYKKQSELIGKVFEMGNDPKTRICTKYNLGNKCLIMHLIQSNYISTEKVARVMLEVDRNDFAPAHPYADRPIPIGNNMSISAPHMHAVALEYLSDYCTIGAKILDIESGSGFLTVALSKMTNDTGTVVGIEHIPELYDFGLQNIKKHHSQLIQDGKIILLNRDGRKGYKKDEFYNVIHVGAACEQHPMELLKHLDKNGRMFIPVGKRGSQNINIYDRDDSGKITCKSIFSVNYIMLSDIESQLNQ